MVKELPSPCFARRELRLAGYLSFVIDDFFVVLPMERSQQPETCNIMFHIAVSSSLLKCLIYHHCTKLTCAIDG